jgi:5-methylcytosine-specific restriction endonuclease McrA
VKAKASKATRNFVRQRAGNRCEECGAKETRHNPLTVHHIKPRSQFPRLADDPNNCILLCEFPCHYFKHHNREED